MPKTTQPPKKNANANAKPQNKNAKNANKKPATSQQQGQKKDANKKNANQQIKKQQQKERPKVTNEKGSRQAPAKPTKGAPAKATKGAPAKQTKGAPAKATKGSVGKATKGGTEQSKQTLELIIKSKFLNPEKRSPTELEQQICSHLVDLEATSKDLKVQLRDLGIVSARQFQVTPTKQGIVIFVPFVQHTKYKKIQSKLVRELEKKFSGQDVIFLAQRKIMKLNQIKNNYPRPRNQTITSVHESLLEDLVYPVKIVGKRLRFRVGGKRLLKVYLDPKESKEIEPKLATFEAIYQKLTKKETKFMFPRFTI